MPDTTHLEEIEGYVMKYDDSLYRWAESIARKRGDRARWCNKCKHHLPDIDGWGNGSCGRPELRNAEYWVRCADFQRNRPAPYKWWHGKWYALFGKTCGSQGRYFKSKGKNLACDLSNHLEEI